MLAFAIHRSNRDLRWRLLANIMFSGDSTLFKAKQSEQACPKDIETKMSASQAWLCSTWVGGSTLAFLNTFREMWASKKEEDEDGSHTIHCKT